MTDNELLEQIAAGHLEAFEPLWDRYYPQLLGYALKRMPEDAAEDAVADTMEGVLKAMNNGNGPRKHARGYLFQALRNTIIAWRKQPERVSADIDEHELALPVGSTTESAALVGHVLRNLPPEDSMLLSSVLIEGLDVAQVAAREGQAPERVSTQLYRAKRRFRTRWVQAHVDLSDAPQECRDALALVGAVEASTATRAQTRVYDLHLATCPDCPARVSEVRRSAAALSVVLPAAFGIYALNGAGGVAAGVMPAVVGGSGSLATGALASLSAFWSGPKLLTASAASTAVSAAVVGGLLAAAGTGQVPAVLQPTQGAVTQESPATTVSTPSSSDQALSTAKSSAPSTSAPSATAASQSPSNTSPGRDTEAPGVGTPDEPLAPASPTSPVVSVSPTTASPSPTSLPTERETCSWSAELECLPAR